jgi:branched-chain amino acid transport system substrate-binding protein
MKITRRDFSKLGLAASAALAAPAIWRDGRAQTKTIRVGCSASLTGALSGTKNMVIGYELWRDDVNAAGGLLGRQVELIVYDDQSTPSNVPAIYSKLVDVDKVDFLFTPYGANLTATIMPFAKQRDRFVVGILTLASNDKVKHDKFFQAAPWGADGGTKWASGFFELAQAQGVKKIAIAAADTEFSKTAAQGGRTVCEQSGIQVVDFQMYPPTNKDFSGILRNIKAAGPEAVFICSYPGDSTAIIRGIQEIGLGDGIKLFGGGMVGPQYASIMEALGPALNGIVNFHLYVPEPTLKFKGIESLLSRYEPVAKQKQVDPLGFYIPPFTYGAGQIIAAGVAGSGSVDQAEVSKWLHANPIETVVGKIGFDEIGNWTERRVLMVQFQGVDGSGLDQFRKPGRQVVVSPADYKSGELKPFLDARKA